MNTVQSKIEGIEIPLGGELYIVPPLNFKSLRALAVDIDNLSAIKGQPSPDQMLSMCKIAHAAIARNYPDITLDKVEDVMDLGNGARVIKAIMGASGMLEATAEK